MLSRHGMYVPLIVPRLLCVGCLARGPGPLRRFCSMEPRRAVLAMFEEKPRSAKHAGTLDDQEKKRKKSSPETQNKQIRKYSSGPTPTLETRYDVRQRL